MDFWNLIYNDSWLKKLPEFWFKWTHDLKNLSESWFESTHDSMMLFIPSFVWLFWAFNFTVDLVLPFWVFHSSVDFVWHFLDFRFKCLPQWTDLNQLMTQTVSQRLWIDSTHDSSGFPVIDWIWINSWLRWIPRCWFRLTHDSKCFPIFQFNLTQDSSEKDLIESTRDSTLSHNQSAWHGCQGGPF